jgi:hypothetical protein
MTTISEKLAEKKGWYKDGKHWVSGPEQMPSIEKACSAYTPTEDFKQATAELTADVLCYYSHGGKTWYVYRNAEDFIADEQMGMYVSCDAEQESLPMAICMMLVERKEEQE